MSATVIRGLSRVGLLIAMAGLVLVPASGALAQGKAAKTQHVLIGFKSRPGQTEQTLVRGLGGKMRYHYGVAPVIAAEMSETAIAQLQRNAKVAFVEADSLVWAVGAVEPTSETLPWGVDRIDADAVWDADGDLAVDPGANVGAGISVALIDSGVDYEHPELADCYAGGWDYVNNDNDPWDDYGHGTHVCGTLAAADNDAGVVGVAPGVAVYALKVLDVDGYGYMSDVIAALDDCRTLGVRVANLSLGGPSSKALELACQNAYDDGVLLVAAAGNNGRTVLYPARYNTVIAVSATDQNDRRASFSSYGSQIELAAPGVGILSTVPGGGYESWSGTSMAAPHVTGAAALVMAAYPELTNEEVRLWLDTTAWDLGAAGRDRDFGFGLVDAYAAAVGRAPPALVSIEVAPAAATVAVGRTRQFTATGVYDDGSSEDLSGEVEWTIWNAVEPEGLSPALIDQDGLATGLAAGTAIVQAAVGKVYSNEATLIVELEPADEIAITRADYSVRNRRLTVEATSTAAPQAVLSVVSGNGTIFYGEMRYNSRTRRYTLDVRNVANPGNSVVVGSDFGGIAVAAVRLTDLPRSRW